MGFLYKISERSQTASFERDETQNTTVTDHGGQKTLLVTQRSPLITGQEKKKEDDWKLLRGLNPNPEVCTVRSDWQRKRKAVT